MLCYLGFVVDVWDRGSRWDSPLSQPSLQYSRIRVEVLRCSGQEGMKASRQGSSPSLPGREPSRNQCPAEFGSAAEEVLAGELGLGARGILGVWSRGVAKLLGSDL